MLAVPEWQFCRVAEIQCPKQVVKQLEITNLVTIR